MTKKSPPKQLKLKPAVERGLIRQMKEKDRKNLVGPFSSADEFMKSLTS